MASSSSSSSSNHHSEPAKIEQIITEFFAKSLHIILESRSASCVSSRHHYSGEVALMSSPSPSSSSSSSSSVRPRDKWFNLALRECPAALENLDFWRQSNLEPMVVDVILVQTPHSSSTSTDGGGKSGGFVRNLSLKERWKSEKVIERWVVQYETRKGGRDCNSATSSNKRGSGSISHSLYKKTIILLRSLYLTVKILPAYKLFRDLNSSAHVGGTYSLTHRVTSLVDHFTRREEAEMRQFRFTPVDTSCGRLCLSVLYCSSLLDVSSEPSTLMSPQFILDYVGSPTTETLKRFPSLPVSQGSPSYVAFSRRHSWGNDLSRVSAPSMSPSPSPTYSDSCALSSNPKRALSPAPPHHRLKNPYSPNAYLAHDKDANFDDYFLSPMYSPSTSPSSPTHSSGYNTLLWSESAPVKIPAAKLEKCLTLPNSHIPPLSPSPRGRKPNCSLKTDTTRALVRVGDIRTGLTTQKMCSVRTDEIGNHSGSKLSSHSSPRVSFSRSSGRLSFQDDLDDEFACPFAVDDDDITDPRTRPESFDGRDLCEPFEPGRFVPVRKSRGAAVGALVRILQTAQPLCRDGSNSKNHLQATKSDHWNKSMDEPDERSSSAVAVESAATSGFGVTSAGLLMLKTTSKALEELRSYREMKETLLKHGTESRTFSNVSQASETGD